MNSYSNMFDTITQLFCLLTLSSCIWPFYYNRISKVNSNIWHVITRIYFKLDISIRVFVSKLWCICGCLYWYSFSSICTVAWFHFHNMMAGYWCNIDVRLHQKEVKLIGSNTMATNMQCSTKIHSSYTTPQKQQQQNAVPPKGG